MACYPDSDRNEDVRTYILIKFNRVCLPKQNLLSIFINQNKDPIYF